ncbi:MAG: hypothetical protein HY094_03350 [Candidatus Melainabacteria bacterium]|nr:hypothetical protein [Candidatus Melainabacteria bacterium]
MKKHKLKSNEKLIEVNFTKKNSRLPLTKNNLSEYNKIKIVDYIYPLTKLSKKIFSIKDHVNLSGINPLKGPNFVSLTDTYSSKKGVIVAGLKNGVHPNDKEKKILLNVGVQAYCYNLVPTAILAASLGLQIKAIGIVKSR